MDRLGELLKTGWAKYRGIPLWGQGLIALVVLSIIVGPFLSESEETPEFAAEETATTSESSTTTSEISTTTTSEEPDPTTSSTTTTDASPPSLQDRIEADNDGSIEIAAADLGDAWPLSVPDGVLACRPGHAVVFGTEETIYAVNGTARGRAQENGWHEIDEIWLDNPDLEGTKINIGPLIDIGLELCD